MIILIAIVVVFNAIVYLSVYIGWKIDCRDIGKDNLAVPLKERIGGAFLWFTLPSILGLLMRKR